MLSDVYFPRINGVSTSIKTFRQELRQLGHDSTLIAPAYDHETTDEHNIIRITSRYLPIDPEDRMMRYRDIIKLADTFKKQAYDLIHIQTPFVAHYAGVKLASLLRLPVVETYHTLFEEYLFHYVPYSPRALMRFAARRFTSAQCNQVDAMIVPSSPMLDVLRAYGVRAPVEIVPTGLQPDRFRSGDGAAFRHRHGIAQDRPVLVHVGRIAHEKNIGFLLQVLDRVRHEIPDILMIIAGEGPALTGLKKMSSRLGLQQQTCFVGYLARDGELLDCYSAGDAFVFSSRTETQGLVLLEAMALGVPVVSTAIQGTRDILKGACGAVVAEDDIGDFSTKVITLLRDKALRKRLAEEGRAYAATWSAAALAQKMERFFAGLVRRWNQPEKN
jgi:glycosyltransferase involved in cell wall biosynthesis